MKVFNTTFLSHTVMMSSTRSHVFVTRPDFPPEAIALLKEKCDVEQYKSASSIPRQKLLELVKDKDGLYVTVTEKVDTELLDAAGPRLKCISTLSVGFDHINLDECRKRHIKVGYTPYVLTKTVAELTVALLLAAARRVAEADKALRNGQWTTALMPTNWMFGVDIAGSTVGIIGMGRIGCAVAKRLHAFEPARMLYFDVMDSAEACSIGAQRVNFQTLLKHSDFVLCCCALTTDTKALFNKHSFSQMKSSAIFVNTSRGGVVDQDALYTALTTGQISAAALDVMTPEPLPKDHPLTKLDNCVLLPHLGSATTACRRKMGILAAENLLAGMNNEEMPAGL